MRFFYETKSYLGAALVTEYEQISVETPLRLLRLAADDEFSRTLLLGAVLYRRHRPYYLGRSRLPRR